MPLLAATPPWKDMGFSSSRPRITCPLKLRIIAKHSPATMSWTGVPTCCRCIISLLAKTLQRPATRGGCSDFKAVSPKSSMETPMRDACWSRKEPVPAAHAPLSAKSATLGRAFPSSFLSTMSFESSPPISKIDFTSGWKCVVPAACAVISLTKGIPSRLAISCPPVPVAAAALNWVGGYLVKRLLV